jgi:hypothetical protein
VVAGHARLWILGWENTIIWTANPALSLPAWSFKYLLVINGNSDPVGAYSASTEQRNCVLLGGLVSTSDAATSSATIVTRAVGCPLSIRTGCHLPSLSTSDVVAGEGTTTHSGEHLWRSLAGVAANNLDVWQRSIQGPCSECYTSEATAFPSDVCTNAVASTGSSLHVEIGDATVGTAACTNPP